jgi:hypothetical protein
VSYRGDVALGVEWSRSAHLTPIAASAVVELYGDRRERAGRAARCDRRERAGRGRREHAPADLDAASAASTPHEVAAAGATAPADLT